MARRKRQFDAGELLHALYGLTAKQCKEQLDRAHAFATSSDVKEFSAGVAAVVEYQKLDHANRRMVLGNAVLAGLGKQGSGMLRLLGLADEEQKRVSAVSDADLAEGIRGFITDMTVIDAEVLPEEKGQQRTASTSNGHGKSGLAGLGIMVDDDMQDAV